MFNNCKFFEKSFNYGNVANALITTSGKFVMANSKYCELLGYSNEELLNSDTSLVIPTSSHNSEKDKIETLFNKNLDNIEYNAKRKSKNGTLLDVSINAIKLQENDTSEIYILKQIDSITEAKSLQEEIKQKQFLLDTIMTEMPAHIYFKDLNSRFIQTSSDQAKYFKVKNAKDMIGKTDFDYFTKEHAQKAFDDEQTIIKKGIRINTEEKLTWPNGSITWAHSRKQPLKDSNGTIRGTFGISMDITETVKSKRKEKEASEKLERKNKELGITLKNLKETQAQLVNNEKMAALGQLISGIAHEINTPLGAINASNSNISHSLKQVFTILPRLYSNFNPNEVYFITSLLKEADFSTIQLPSREKRALRKVLTEKFQKSGIPQSRNLADHIIYMNLQDKVDELIPELLKIDVEKTIGATKLLVSLSKNSQNIGTATEKASNVVLALKKFIHRSADDAKTIANIKENIETVLTLNQNRLKHGIELVKIYSEKEFKLECYPDELSQVWNNLISNAIHAMNGRGQLTIELKEKGSTHLSVIISDSGCGIPEEIRESIFTPLFTTKVSGEGTGIGLDIVKRIVEKHDGKIHLHSVINEGTSFTIDLPIKTSLS